MTLNTGLSSTSVTIYINTGCCVCQIPQDTHTHTHKQTLPVWEGKWVCGGFCSVCDGDYMSGCWRMCCRWQIDGHRQGRAERNQERKTAKERRGYNVHKWYMEWWGARLKCENVTRQVQRRRRCSREGRQQVCNTPSRVGVREGGGQPRLLTYAECVGEITFLNSPTRESATGQFSCSFSSLTRILQSEWWQRRELNCSIQNRAAADFSMANSS